MIFLFNHSFLHTKDIRISSFLIQHRHKNNSAFWAFLGLLGLSREPLEGENSTQTSILYVDDVNYLHEKLYF